MAGMVIIGAGMAGARGVINLRANGYDGPITLVGEETHLPYDRPPLSKASITAEVTPEPVLLLDQGIVTSLKADVLTDSTATAISPSDKSVTLSDGRKLTYDKLLLATGAKPRKLNVSGGEHALLLRNHEDALALRERFRPVKHIVVIGGGFIGLELASSAQARGCSVTLVEAQPRILLRGVPEAIAHVVHERHVAAGVRLLTGVGITALRKDAVELATGEVLPADTIIAGIGAAPDIRLAQDAGLAIDNGIACNAHMQSSDPHIYAAGDCASFPHVLFGDRRIRLEAWRSAQEQAATAAENMVGGSKTHASVPWFWSDQYDLSLQIAGFAEQAATTVTRDLAGGGVVLFHLKDDGTIVGASGIGVGNAVGRDIKLAEMMIAKRLKPDPALLADPAQQLKSILKG